MTAMTSSVLTLPTSWQPITSPSASRPFAVSLRTNTSARSGQRTQVASGSTQSITPRDCTPNIHGANFVCRMGTAGGELVTLLAPLHVQNEDALLIGILFGLIVLIAALPGGLSLLLDWGKE